jgi:hypothetical protein
MIVESVHVHSAHKRIQFSCGSDAAGLRARGAIVQIELFSSCLVFVACHITCTSAAFTEVVPRIHKKVQLDSSHDSLYRTPSPTSPIPIHLRVLPSIKPPNAYTTFSSSFSSSSTIHIFPTHSAYIHHKPPFPRHISNPTPQAAHHISLPCDKRPDNPRKKSLGAWATLYADWIFLRSRWD